VLFKLALGIVDPIAMLKRLWTF